MANVNNMIQKNIVVCAAIIAVLLVLAACKKDGVYKPGDKIAGFAEYSETDYQRYDSQKQQWITYRSDSVRRYTTEKWNWDGNQLNRIDFYTSASSTSADHSLVFSYDGKRLQRIYNSKTKGYALCNYDGRNIKEMLFHDKNGKQTGSISFEHDGKRISAMTISGTAATKGDYGASQDEMTRAALVFVAGDAGIAAESIKTLARERKTENGITLTLTWKNDNISRIEFSDGSQSASFTYDRNPNPMKGFLGTLVAGTTAHDMYLCCNANNTTSSTITASDGSKDVLNYSYTYSGELPVSRSRSVVDHYAQGNRIVYSYVTYYQYVDD